MKLNKRITAMELAPEDENFLHERAFTVSLRDEGAGEYVMIEQVDGKLAVEAHEWESLVEVVSEMVERINPESDPTPTKNHIHSFDGATMHGGSEG